MSDQPYAVFRAEDGSEIIQVIEMGLADGDVLFRPSACAEPYSVRITGFDCIRGRKMGFTFLDVSTDTVRRAEGTGDELVMDGVTYTRVAN